MEAEESPKTYVGISFLNMFLVQDVYVYLRYIIMFIYKCVVILYFHIQMCNNPSCSHINVY